MRTVYKYALNLHKAIYHGEMFVISMHRGALLMSVQNQHDKLVIWALVDNDLPLVNRNFIVYYTGEEIPFLESAFRSQKYISSVQIMGGDYVFHVFELFQEPQKNPLTEMFDHFKPAT
jgi:hypothetical protein